MTKGYWVTHPVETISVVWTHSRVWMGSTVCCQILTLVVPNMASSRSVRNMIHKMSNARGGRDFIQWKIRISPLSTHPLWSIELTHSLSVQATHRVSISDESLIGRQLSKDKWQLTHVFHRREFDRVGGNNKHANMSQMAQMSMGISPGILRMIIRILCHEVNKSSMWGFCF